MLRKRAKPASSAGSNKQQHEIAFDHGHGGGGGPTAISAPKLFVSSSSGEGSPERQPEAVLMSPTSTLQTASATSPAAVTCSGRSSGAKAVPFSRRRNDNAGRAPDGDGRCKSNRPWDAKHVGLGLFGALNDREVAAPGDVAATASSVLTGQRLRVQTNYYAPCSPRPCTEFGVKSGGRGGAGAAAAADHLAHYPSPRHRCMSPREMMEMSEDYTCVIARGPNPRTTHIFDNRVVESSGALFPSALRLPSAAGKDDDDDFLHYCHGCRKDIGHGKGIFMYRGEKAFCSRECRYHEMLFDEGIEEL